MASLTKINNTYYLRYRVGKKPKKVSLRTTSLQIAKEKKRQFESAQLRGNDNPLPTRTPIPTVLTDYVQHIRATKSPKSAQNDIYYLREMFGPCCEALTITSRSASAKTRKKPSKSKIDGRKNLPIIEAACFEAISTAQIADFIGFKVRDQGLKPKTANHYRSILRRVFNWADQERGIKLPGGINPASRVRPYKEQAPQIRYLTLNQIEEQLHTLRFKPQLQTMVAMLIYAGLRREELLWLTLDDVSFSRRQGGHGLIHIRAKTIDGRSWQPKTAENRSVPISRSLREYLARYTPLKTSHPSEQAWNHSGGGGWFFPSPGSRWEDSAGGWWDPDNFSRDLREANKDAGLQWSCLDYRHTFGSQLAQNGVSLYKISKLMGNSPEICRRHYASLVPEAMYGEVEFGNTSNIRGKIHAS